MEARVKGLQESSEPCKGEIPGRHRSAIRARGVRRSPPQSEARLGYGARGTGVGVVGAAGLLFVGATISNCTAPETTVV